jgi:large subunit ribosomal protein L23
MDKNPYAIVKWRHNTEKARVLANLKNSKSNKSVAKCDQLKAVFIVDKKANKKEIAWAVESIYSNKNVKVTAVNTVLVKPKVKRVRGHLGKTAFFKKAIVTFRAGDEIDEPV